jgi:chromate transporter
VSRTGLFLGFLKIGLLGFGGVAAVARHVIVEERGWLTDREYASVLGTGQVLPGANTVNAAVMIGDRFHGLTGAILAVTALMAMPLAILVGLASLYDRVSAAPDAEAAISGTAAAAAGLVVGTALKMAWRLQPTFVAVIIGFLTFVGVGVLQVSLIAAVLILAPVSVWAASYGRHR